jgi:hypothetical protein
LSLKIRQVKKWPSPIIKFHSNFDLYNLSMLANFQTNRMIGTSFIGLERSMMFFCGKKHHLGIFFLALPNNVRLTSKLYRMHKNKSSTRFWVIQSRVEVHLGAKGVFEFFLKNFFFKISLFSTLFFDLFLMGNSNSKIIFCIINLVHWQVFRRAFMLIKFLQPTFFIEKQIFGFGNL